MRFLHKIVVLFAIILITASCELFNSAYDPITITGKITNTSGDAISGVKVYARSYLSNDSVISSSDGRYKLKLSRAGIFRVEFKKENFTAKTYDKDIHGGEWLKLDVTMTMLSEDAFLEIPETNFTIQNNKNSIFVKINKNITILAIPTVDWLSVDDMPTGVLIHHEENDNNAPRSGSVIVEGEHGLKDTINITQQPGPVLKLIDFLGKDNLTKFPKDVPFLKFSRAVTVTRLIASATQTMPTLLYSEDSTTIFFPDVKTDYFSEQKIYYNVRSSDGVELDGNLALNAYINYFNNEFAGGTQKVLFADDNRSFWVYQSAYQGKPTLKKFDITYNLASVKSIALQENLVDIYYNPYNNALYLQKQYQSGTDYLTDIELYSAETGNYLSKFTLEKKSAVISSMVFDNKGFGLAIYNGNIYSIDAANNHHMEILTQNSMLYDSSQGGRLIPRNVNICNNNSTFVMHGTDYSGKLYVYSYNVGTKMLKQEYSSSGYANVFTGNDWLGAVLTTIDRKSIRYLDFNPGTNKIIYIREGINNAVLLPVEGAAPVVLCEDASLVDVINANQILFNPQRNYTIAAVSSDNSIVALRYNNKLYFFRSEMFTEYFSKFN